MPSHTRTISRRPAVPVPAAGIRAPDNFWDRLAMKLGLKTF